MQTENEAEGSTISVKEAEGASTEKEKNEAHAVANTAFSDSGISMTFPNRFGTHYNQNRVPCQSQWHEQSSRRVVIDNDSTGGNCISRNTSGST